MEALSVVGSRIKESLHHKSVFESPDPDEFYPHLAEAVMYCEKALWIYGWDKEVDGREGFRYALESALTNETPIFLDGKMHVAIKVVLKKGQLPQSISYLIDRYGNRILVSEKPELKYRPFKLIDPYTCSSRIELTRPCGEKTVRAMVKGTLAFLLESCSLRDMFSAEFYS